VRSPNSGEQRPDRGRLDPTYPNRTGTSRSAADRSGAADELAVIEQLRRRFESAVPLTERAGARTEVGIGDDATVVLVGASDERLVLSVDVCVEGVHFDLGVVRLEDAGWKSLMVAASDIAAMGAKPVAALMSVAAPVGTDLDRFGAGAAEASARLGCAVVGGDLSGGPVVSASVTVIGTLPDDGSPALLRSGARPDDVLLVTGALGSSAAGLRALRSDRHASGALVDAHRRPVAAVAEGLAARRGEATAAIDVSDGLVGDLRHLLVASGVGAALDHVPVAEGADLEEALGGGEDYVLLLAAPDPDRLRGAFAAAGLPEPVVIGRCTEEPGRLLLDGEPLADVGWRHRF